MQALEKTIRVDLSAFHLARVRRIDREDFVPIKKKYMRECVAAGQSVSEDHADRGILALKQYYAAGLLDPYNSHAISDEVDPLWHTHILFSEQYVRFCNDVVGAYIHHIPLDQDYELGVKNVDTLYNYTREVVTTLFTEVDDRLWPRIMPKERLICFYKGNRKIYADDIYQHAILPMDDRGANYAFS